MPASIRSASIRRLPRGKTLFRKQNGEGSATAHGKWAINDKWLGKLAKDITNTAKASGQMVR
jgi:hypothetical protein